MTYVDPLSMLRKIWHVLTYVQIYVYRGHFVEKFKGVLCDRDLQMTLSFRNPGMFKQLFASGHVYQVD